jgi:hypothetical protein
LRTRPRPRCPTRTRQSRGRVLTGGGAQNRFTLKKLHLRQMILRYHEHFYFAF